MKLSLKEKHLVIFLCHKEKKLFYVKRIETFFDTLEFQIQGEGGINGKAGKNLQS